jgi:uncharacterized zinc-type alcohol dehydrogenase-like protein
MAFDTPGHDTAAFGTKGPDQNLEPLTIPRRHVGPKDVAIDITYCGVCHTDIHFGHDDWGMTTYPLVPGHEIVGRVTSVGDEVTAHKIGDLVGVGCLVDSCRACPSCAKGDEQYCQNGATQTYGSPDPHLGGTTHGGYSASIVVDEHFVLRVPDSLDTKAVAPLLCAGITTYSPLRHWNVKPGQKVGVIGLGGLGHMGVKFAAAMGAEVTMITRSAAKGEDAKSLGAHRVLLSNDEDAMASEAGSFDFLLNTIPVGHDINPYLQLLKIDAAMAIVGAVDAIEPVQGFNLIFGRRSVGGSLIGGLPETQEMLDFCAEHDIVCDVEMIGMQDVNEAWKRVQAADVKYRFVIDMASLKGDA